MQTGLCIDGASGNVGTGACSGSSSQNWVTSAAVFGSTQTVEIVNSATGLCLDSNADGDVYTIACNRGNYQFWVPRASGGDGGVPPETLVDFVHALNDNVSDGVTGYAAVSTVGVPGV